MSKAAKQTKVDLVKKYRTHKNDTGSAEVQVALLSNRVNELIGHLRSHNKDTDSRRGLLMMVGKRRRLLNYVKKESADRYEKLVADLGLRK